eukprot:scaffold124636_cov18-Tisochrysis_lutea.AAC.1
MVVVQEQHACRQLEHVIEAGRRQAAYEAYILRLHHQPTQSGQRSSSNSKFSRGARGGARSTRGAGGRGRGAKDVWVAGADAPTAVVAGSRGGWRGGRRKREACHAQKLLANNAICVCGGQGRAVRAAQWLPAINILMVDHADSYLVDHADNYFVDHADSDFVDHADSYFEEHADNYFVAHADRYCLFPRFKWG